MFNSKYSLLYCIMLLIIVILIDWCIYRYEKEPFYNSTIIPFTTKPVTTKPVTTFPATTSYIEKSINDNYKKINEVRLANLDNQFRLNDINNRVNNISMNLVDLSPKIKPVGDLTFY